MEILAIVGMGLLQLMRRAVRVYIRNASFSVPCTAGAIGGWVLGRVANLHALVCRLGSVEMADCPSKRELG